MCEFHDCNGNGFGDIWWTDKCTYFSSIDMAAMLVLDLRWSMGAFYYLEILTVENVVIDTQTKSLDCLMRKIFVIERFRLISRLIRPLSITKNAMDKIFSIRQFPRSEHPYIAFPQKNLAVLDISRFTTGEIGPQSRLQHTHTFTRTYAPVMRSLL